MCVPTGRSTGISTVPSSVIVPFTCVPSGNVTVTVAPTNASPVVVSFKDTITVLLPRVVLPGIAPISARRSTTSSVTFPSLSV